MIISRHASYGKSSAGWNGVSRSESRRRADAGVREGGRLSGLRASVERDARRSTDADRRVLPDAPPLAFASLARTRRGPGRVHAAFGRWTCRRIGWSESTAPITRSSWRRCVAASSVGGLTGHRNGRGGLPSVLACNQRLVRRVGQGSRETATKSSTPNDRCTLPYLANI